MNRVQYVFYKCIKPLSNWLSKIEGNIRSKCDHTYPNGESSLKPDQMTELCEECVICGLSIMKDEAYAAHWNPYSYEK